MSRQRATSTVQQSGCFVCYGSDAKWTGSNAIAVAAKHHDATGHQTWADQVISIRYGAQAEAQKEGP